MLETLSSVLEFSGVLLIGVMVLRVHIRMGKEHKIDNKVIKEINIEKIITVFGLTLITIGFILGLI